VRLDFQVFGPEGLVTARGMERLRFVPWGVAGGVAGTTGQVVMNPGTPAERAIPKIDVLALEPGDVLSVRTPGGGGHGDPLARPPAAVLADVAAALVSTERAREAYAVIVDGDHVDEVGTAALRAARRGVATGAGQDSRTVSPAEGGVTFDFGPARRDHEHRWPADLQDRFVELLMSLPAPYRAYVRRTLHARAAALPAGQPLTIEDLRRLWEDLRPSIGLG
jgi:N-methylhydantoinase B